MYTQTESYLSVKLYASWFRELILANGNKIAKLTWGYLPLLKFQGFIQWGGVGGKLPPPKKPTSVDHFDWDDSIFKCKLAASPPKNFFAHSFSVIVTLLSYEQIVSWKSQDDMHTQCHHYNHHVCPNSI